MAQNGYDGPITLAAGITRLVTALQAAGYTGRFNFLWSNLRNTTGAVIYFAKRSDVSAANGRDIPDTESFTWPEKKDMSIMYVYSLAGGTAYFSGETR
jgi:hypothetical protein